MPPGPLDPDLTWTDTGEPRSGRFGDVYFSADDGLAESRAVFLHGCGLPDAWVDRSHFTVGELGFGTGLNIAALLDLWRRTRPAGARLNVFSVEGFPLSREDAARALSAWPELTDVAEPMLQRWPSPTPGFHRIDLIELDAVIDLAVGDVDWALANWTGRADAWFLDGFAPAANPAMWSDTVLDRIAARSRPDARLATFTVAGSVRRGLAERGFAVEKRPGHGRKRERLEARRTGVPMRHERAPSVAVIGAGIAGGSMVRALAAEGVAPLLIEAEGRGAGASGFPAALVTPRFDLGDGAVAALFVHALTRARVLYRSMPGVVLAEGVVQLARDRTEATRFDRLAEQPIWPPGALEAADETLRMRDALTVAPEPILSAWLASAQPLPGRAARIEPGRQGGGDGWRVLDGTGGVLAEADRLVVCAGAGTAGLIDSLALSPVRGQADWVSGDRPPATAWGGYVAPTAEGFLFGATHDRGDVGTDVRTGDTRRNLATLAARLPDLALGIDPAACRSRAAIRATSRDRLPLAGPVAGLPGLFVLGGLGSRGFCLAPLLAEHVAAAVLDRPSPLAADVIRKIDPGRTAALA